MKPHTLPLIALLLAFAAVSQALAADMQNNPVAVSVKPAAAAQPSLPPAKTKPVDNGGVWTSYQLEKLCYNRASGNARMFDNCMRVHANKLGKAKQSGEVAELNLADQRLARKAAERLKQTQTDQQSSEAPASE